MYLFSFHSSTNAQVLTQQAASWASWAVGAIGAKFYKSANKPPEQVSSSKESTPTPKSTIQETSTTKKFEKKTPITTTEDNIAQIEDGWNDDDADWGSLEDCKLIIKSFSDL